MIFTLSTKLTFIWNTRILFRESRAPRTFILKIFKEYFVVCPVELQGINNILICPILSPYFSGPWSWTEYQCHNYHALVVCDQVGGLSGGIRLASFVLAGLMIANENVDLPYFGGPWTDYQCHRETTSNYIISSEYSRPRPMRLCLNKTRITPSPSVYQSNLCVTTPGQPRDIIRPNFLPRRRGRDLTVAGHSI